MCARALKIDFSVSSRHALLIAAAAGLLVSSLKNWLEVDMLRHMLIEFPLLLIAGRATGRALVERFGTQFERCNRMGLFGFVFASTTLAYWMIPAALDAALLDGWVAAAKYASLVLSGALLWSSFSAAPLPLQAFFVGNLTWMTATIGLIYQSAPRQLCLNYLPDAQLSTGEGLVSAAVIGGLAWCASAAPGFLNSEAGARAAVLDAATSSLQSEAVQRLSDLKPDGLMPTHFRNTRAK